MRKMRMRDASISITILLCAMPLAARAQDVVDEDTAIERALAREGIFARDDADRASSAAEIDVIGPRDNPSVELSREGAGGENEYQLGVVQPIDLNGRRGSLRDAARADQFAVHQCDLPCEAAEAEQSDTSERAQQLGEGRRYGRSRHVTSQLWVRISRGAMRQHLDRQGLSGRLLGPAHSCLHQRRALGKECCGRDVPCAILCERRNSRVRRPSADCPQAAHFLPFCKARPRRRHSASS